MDRLAPESNRYRTISKLCSGGMADIFLGVQMDHLALQRLVVVKQVHATADSDDDTVGMFADEARIVSTLNHPNIVQIFDFARGAEGFYIVMEYIDGENLGFIMRELRKQQLMMPLPISLRFMDQALDALHYIHTATSRLGEPLNIIHRDLDPRNLMIDSNGYLKIIDFGVAKAAIQNELTAPGLFKGKLTHVAPEIVTQSDIDHRADIYTIGLVLFEMVTGKKPYTFGKSPILAEAIKRIVDEPIPNPSSINPDVPVALGNIILCACQKNREFRFQSVQELHHALLKFAYNPAHSIGIATNNEVKQWFQKQFEARLKKRRLLEKRTLQKATHEFNEYITSQPPFPVQMDNGNTAKDELSQLDNFSSIGTEPGISFSSSITQSDPLNPHSSGSMPPFFPFEERNDSGAIPRSNRHRIFKIAALASIFSLVIFVVLFLSPPGFLPFPWLDSENNTLPSDSETVVLKSSSITITAPQPKAKEAEESPLAEDVPREPAKDSPSPTEGVLAPPQKEEVSVTRSSVRKQTWTKAYRSHQEELEVPAEESDNSDTPSDDANRSEPLPTPSNDIGEEEPDTREKNVELKTETPSAPSPQPSIVPLPPPVAPAKSQESPVGWLSKSGKWNGATVAQKGCSHCHSRPQPSEKTASQWEYYFSHNRHRKNGDLKKKFSPEELKRVQAYFISNCQSNKNRSSGIAGIR